MILTLQITNLPNWKIDRLDCAKRQLSPPLVHNNMSNYIPIANLAHYSNLLMPNRDNIGSNLIPIRGERKCGKEKKYEN